MVPVGLWFTSVARLKQETGVSLDLKFHRNQPVDRKRKEVELKPREKIQVKSLKQRPPVGLPVTSCFRPPDPHSVDLVAKSRGQVNAGLTSPAPGSGLVWTQEGSEIRVADRKEGWAGQRAAPQPSPVPRAPGFSFSKVLLTVARLLRTPGGETRMGCLSRQISGSELPRGTWSRVG